ncbi:MAG: class I SAM-dependent methyltransferase [Candidatus Nanopelagicaceae bacterium]|nr:class I SAM-dependent methyltransferase [Candidatus Nanopelagicaceae bacterium]
MKDDSWHCRTREELALAFAKHRKFNGVEVGVLRGDFSAVLLADPNTRLWLVDSWKHVDGCIDENNSSSEQHEKNYLFTVNRFQDERRVTILRATALEAATMTPDNSLDFVYLDADHRYEETLKAITAWYPKLKLGGIMSGHDYLDSQTGNTIFGVKCAVDSFVIKINLQGGLHLTQESSWPSWWFIKE